ncbi:hypothetical protein GGQ87_001967 [Brevundimonas alba]|uniref:Uncharacterized protein n=1 Tax=Brevundimonas alba TaxID=74314 RepID=A0A7X5YN59_9CAUL|nr:hypothetical protein [Brevundimonas alba]
MNTQQTGAYQSDDEDRHHDDETKLWLQYVRVWHGAISAVVNAPWPRVSAALTVSANVTGWKSLGLEADAPEGRTHLQPERE